MKRGILRIPELVYTQSLEHRLAIFRVFIPFSVKFENNPNYDYFEIYGESDLFEEIAENDFIPYYDYLIEDNVPKFFKVDRQNKYQISPEI